MNTMDSRRTEAHLFIRQILSMLLQGVMWAWICFHNIEVLFNFGSILEQD